MSLTGNHRVAVPSSRKENIHILLTHPKVNQSSREPSYASCPRRIFALVVGTADVDAIERRGGVGLAPRLAPPAHPGGPPAKRRAARRPAGLPYVARGVESQPEGTLAPKEITGPPLVPRSLEPPECEIL